MNNIDFKNKMINKYNAITENEYKAVSYGEHFKYAKTTFSKSGVSCVLYVPHQKPEDTFEEEAFESFIPKATVPSHELNRGKTDAFRIGNNMPGGE